MRYRIALGVYQEDVYKVAHMPINGTTVILEDILPDHLDASLLDLSTRLGGPVWKQVRWINISQT